MNLVQIIRQRDEEVRGRARDEEMRLRSKKQPLLAERSELSNIMAGPYGKSNRTPERLARYEELDRQVAELDRKILEVRHEADMAERQPLDIEGVLSEACERLDEAKRHRKWLCFQTLVKRLDAMVVDIESIEHEIAELQKIIERCELALEAKAEFSEAREEVPA